MTTTTTTQGDHGGNHCRDRHSCYCTGRGPSNHHLAMPIGW
jgi:hypothetical protein